MERSTVTGSFEQARRGFAKVAHKGFTLLELMIVISIIIILAAITLPQYQKTIMHTREAVLRDDLFKMRSLLDQFAPTKDACRSRWMISSVKDTFATSRRIRLPGKRLGLTTGEDPSSLSGEQGVTDVHSSSSEVFQRRHTL